MDTRYDNIKMNPITGLEKHPLAGVPQEILDAATKALEEAVCHTYDGFLALDTDDVEAVAHSVLAAVLEAMK